MTAWQEYPEDYRADEVAFILKAARAGDCAALVGLSGSGKSNLLNFIAQRKQLPSRVEEKDGKNFGFIAAHKPISEASAASGMRFVLVDCNRLVEPAAPAFFRLVRRALRPGQFTHQGEASPSAEDELALLETALDGLLSGGGKLCLLLDRFDALTGLDIFDALASSLRAVRDAYKYRLVYVTATRQPLADHTELAELFFGHTLWLGPLSKSDALWSARRDARRFSSDGQDWEAAVLEKLVELSWGYPSLLRAACEAYASGCELEVEALRRHPVVTRRVAEFWADEPDEQALRDSRLLGQPLLGKPPEQVAAQAASGLPGEAVLLTAKEHLLLEYLRAHAGQVCDKDDLVRAVWPEDVIYEQGIRDESLAQLVRRLRVKIEPDPSNPAYIQTVPGRGYLFREER
ncbi:MAG: winged helix-turn-helix domain-containing protein [Chloroflexota bacterium]